MSSSGFAQQAPQVLLPVLIEVPGAYESVFTTELHVFNSSDEPQPLDGILMACQILCPPAEERRVEIEPRTVEFFFALDGGPGRLVSAEKPMSLHFDLRVRDLSRNSLSGGTSIPVVTTDRFLTEPIFITLRSSSDNLFRNMLRIYAIQPTSVLVRFWRRAAIGGVQLQSEVPLDLLKGESNLHPAYVELSQAGFPGPSQLIPGDDVLLVEVVPGGDEPVWAFITTTNNVTQEITIATPGNLPTVSELEPVDE